MPEGTVDGDGIEEYIIPKCTTADDEPEEDDIHWK